MNEVGADELKRLNEQLAEKDSDRGAYYLGDYVGRRGLERRYEQDLRGIDGKERVPVDAKGRRKAEADSLIPEDQRVVPSVPGNNLVLSLDWRLQEFAEKLFPATAGVVLAMDARTGFLLALVDRPAPDPNKMSGRITGGRAGRHPLRPAAAGALPRHPAALPPGLDLQGPDRHRRAGGGGLPARHHHLLPGPLQHGPGPLAL